MNQITRKISYGRSVETKCLLAAVFLLLFTHGLGFDINDPKTNLDSFVRTVGSTFNNETVIVYFNGSIFGKLEGGNIHKLFYFEGYSSNRHILQQDGGYLALSCELLVYRDVNTGKILQAWYNNFTGLTNEVFIVANNPVDSNLTVGPIVPTKFIPGGRIVFNLDFVTETDNPLDPKMYPKFSAGNIYETVDLLASFTSYDALSKTYTFQVPFTGTWSHRSQFLPWMEMGGVKGSLFYTTFAWKCRSGLACIAEDIWNLAYFQYPGYIQPPWNYDSPNENSWTTFKDIVDKRRSSGLPDIIIPLLNISSHAQEKKTYVDSRVVTAVCGPPFIEVFFNGTTMTESYGKASIPLMNIEGNVKFSVKRTTSEREFMVNINLLVTFRDRKTGKILKTWINPITGKEISVPLLELRLQNHLLKDGFVYSINISETQNIGVLVADSSSVVLPTGLETWSADFVNAIFPNEELDNRTDPFFYGTWMRYTSWPDWMQMENTTGTMVWKATFYRR